MSAIPEDIEALRERTALFTSFAWLVVSAVSTTVYREKGEQALNDVWRSLMTAEQAGRFREALAKLGIENDPPAIAAAKYHFFSNTIGGLTMHYVEESSKKAWIRYLPPWGSFPGISALAMPTSLRRTILSTWHPRNGELLGCPRLRWVATKFVSEGHPYDEGYFEEVDRDLMPSERMRVEAVHCSPEFDPATAPKLDAVAWTEARRLKGHHNYAADYALHAIEAVVRLFGEPAASDFVRTAMRFLAVQYIGQFTRQTGCTDGTAYAAAKCAATLMRSFRNDVEVSRTSDRVTELRVRGFAPFEPVATPAMREALFAFFEMGTRVVSGRFTASRLSSGLAGVETWRFEDHHQWMQ